MLSRDEILSMIDRKENWTCDKCLSAKTSRRSIVCHGNDEENNDDHDQERETRVTIKDVIELIQKNHSSLTSQLKTFKTAISVIRDSVQYMSDSFENLQKEIKAMKKLLEDRE
ncbi:hypothetical protein HHI36_018842 [Cryptolaemus montrouzieri]|uniref:Uncharacterized protein n=1 Tax=Cryptolaemus montrouzieri TaxID=559131 RepID=A0ABD2P1T1_9CUCU